MKIDFEGRIVTVPNVTEALEICRKIRDDAAEILGKIPESGWTKEQIQAQICGFLQKSLEVLLGEDVATAQFGSGEPSVTELCRVLCHLAAEIGRQLGEGIGEDDV